MGLAAECDPPGAEAAVGQILEPNLRGAGTLPFVGIVTPDLKWVAGFAGYKEVGEFLAVLDQAEKSPLLAASPENGKKLDGLAAQASAAAEKTLWPKLLAAARDATAIPGRHPAREKIAAAVAKARAYAEGEMAKALDSVKSGGDRAAARLALKKLTVGFAGEPEAKEATAGVKALERLNLIDGVAAEFQAAAREKAVKEFAGTRWTAWF